jgi:hypothetical protein
MAKRTCIRLDVPLKVKSEIEMVPEVFWVVSWGEVCLTSHIWFRICSDITQMVQNLWIKNQRFILPLESLYLSKSTVSPIVTLLKCQSTWICSHWIVYSSNYWEGDNNQEYIEHPSRWSHLSCNSCKVKFSCVVNQCCRYLAKPNKAHYEVLRQILSILLELHIRCLRGVPQQHWRKVFKLFQIYSYADTAGMITGTLARVLVVHAECHFTCTA